MDHLAEITIAETRKNGVFVIPGIGRLVKAARKARMGRNPQTGESIKIKAKTVVKFRVAKAVKDMIAPPKKIAPVREVCVIPAGIHRVSRRDNFFSNVSRDMISVFESCL